MKSFEYDEGDLFGKRARFSIRTTVQEVDMVSKTKTVTEIVKDWTDYKVDQVTTIGKGGLDLADEMRERFGKYEEIVLGELKIVGVIC